MQKAVGGNVSPNPFVEICFQLNNKDRGPMLLKYVFDTVYKFIICGLIKSPNECENKARQVTRSDSLENFCPKKSNKLLCLWITIIEKPANKINCHMVMKKL